jgi:hypothetical protein
MCVFGLVEIAKCEDMGRFGHKFSKLHYSTATSYAITGYFRLPMVVISIQHHLKSR